MVLRPSPKVCTILSQQMKSCDSFKIETVGDQSLTDQYDTSSIALTNYNIQRISILSHPSPTRPLTLNNEASTLPAYGRVASLPSLIHRSTVEPLLPVYGRIDSQLSPMSWSCSCFDDFSQSTACIATRFGECSSTMLHKLWYLYSYIYNQVSSNTTTIIIPILLFFVVAILMPPTHHDKLSIVSPSPYLSCTRSFTMANFTTITDISFSFTDHPTCPAFSKALNDTYAEPFNAAVLTSLFPDAR